MVLTLRHGIIGYSCGSLREENLPMQRMSQVEFDPEDGSGVSAELPGNYGRGIAIFIQSRSGLRKQRGRKVSCVPSLKQLSSQSLPLTGKSAHP